MKQASLIQRIRRLFNWQYIVRDSETLKERYVRLRTGGKRLDLTYEDVPPAEVDAYMEKMMKKMKKVPYVNLTGSCEGYSLRFNLQDMCGDTNPFPELNEVNNVVDKKPDADVIVNQVLAELSRTSEFSQDLEISFMMKGGWKGYIKVWLYPKIYYGKPSESKTDFSEIYAVEKDPSFLSWESIYYRDSSDRGSFSVYLNTVDKWDRYCSHYTGICSVSWIDFIQK